MSSSSDKWNTTGSYFSLSSSSSQRKKKKALTGANDASAEATFVSMDKDSEAAPVEDASDESNIQLAQISSEASPSGLFDGSPEFDRFIVDNSIPTTPESLAACREACINALPGKHLPLEQTQYFNSDHNVRRYVVARKGKVGEAGKQLAATLVWRSERGLVDGAVHTPNHLTDSFVPVPRNSTLTIANDHISYNPCSLEE